MTVQYPAMNGVNGKNLAEWIWRAVTALLVPVLIWLAYSLSEINATVQAIDRRVTFIEANRFTASDGTLMWREMDARLDKLEQATPRQP